MCLGILIRSACCCCSACCNDTCKLVKFKCGISRRQQVRLAYIVLNFFAIMFSISLMYIAPTSLGFWTTFIHCPEASGGGLVCLGVSAVYRMSAILVVLYFLCLLACLLRDDCSRIFNENFWCLKISIVVFGFFGFMFVSNDIFLGYATAARYLGAFFLLFQIVMLIDIFYLLGERMKALYDQGYTIMAYVLIVSAIALYSVTFYLNYKNFQWFPCNTIINTVNTVLILVITILVFTGIFKNGSLVTSGCMSLYLTYQIWTGLNNNPEKECNAFLGTDIGQRVEVGFGVVFILASLIYISISSQDKNRSKITQNPNLLENNNQKDSDDDEYDRDFIEEYESDDEEISQKNNNNMSREMLNIQKQQNMNSKESKRLRRLKDYKTNTYIYFHIIMIFGSLYMAMMLTNWGAPVINDMTWSQFKPSNISKNISVGCSYISWIVYIWTLAAPLIFPDRDFS